MGIFSHDEEPSLSEVVSLQKQIRALNDNYRDLQAENEWLKAKVIRLKDFIKSASDIDKINLFYVNKLETCLQEIKEIAENSCCMTDKDLCDNNSCAVCKSVSDADVIKQILQKITKTEEE